MNLSRQTSSDASSHMVIQTVIETSSCDKEMHMGSVNISGSTEITAEGIRKHFKTTEPAQAVTELVWNGFDAMANTVQVTLEKNDLGGLVGLSVLDDGEGIDFNRISTNFGRFNESAKKGDSAQHGSHGRGRLAFHKLAHMATWYTRTMQGEAVISISSDDIKLYDAQILEPDNYHNLINTSSTGTQVVLTKAHGNLPDRDEMLEFLSNEFGWFLALNPTKRLVFNNEAVSVPSHEIHEEVCNVNGTDFKVKVIRWDDKPSSEKSYVYLQGSSGHYVYRQLSSHNNKPNFFTSVYVQSPWADNFEEKPTLFSVETNTPESEVWREISKQVISITRRVYDEYLMRFVERQIEIFEDEGTFPTYADLPPEYAHWRLENAKNLVRSIYTADPTVFNSLKRKQRKILVGLLDRLSVSNENDALFEVLNSVLELDPKSLEVFASQLKRTTLENIISTIELLQRRLQAVQELRELMNVHYAEVRETPDLQKIIENNTWLFGPQYEILGAEETTFTQVAKGLRNAVKEIDQIEDSDLEGDATIEGANRQTDLFLARKIPSFDSFGKRYYRCIVVEIKRPSVALNIKHLRQLDDYANIIKRHPEFTSEHTRFELILLGRKISEVDTEIASRLKQLLPRGEIGLVTDDEHMKRYVLNWYTLLEGYELNNASLLEKLKLRRDEISCTKEELVDSLQAIS